MDERRLFYLTPKGRDAAAGIPDRILPPLLLPERVVDAMAYPQADRERIIPWGRPLTLSLYCGITGRTVLIERGRGK